mmetsp:Transcript_23942/g.60616  ORF Transcript_23942/g.60616 Transcript_23942/m.60616 type:complete len:318 (+) Transcript_23942:948-1901(+)
MGRCGVPNGPRHPRPTGFSLVGCHRDTNGSDLLYGPSRTERRRKGRRETRRSRERVGHLLWCPSLVSSIPRVVISHWGPESPSCAVPVPFFRICLCAGQRAHSKRRVCAFRLWGDKRRGRRDSKERTNPTSPRTWTVHRRGCTSTVASRVYRLFIVSRNTFSPCFFGGDQRGEISAFAISLLPLQTNFHRATENETQRRGDPFCWEAERAVSSCAFPPVQRDGKRRSSKKRTENEPPPPVFPLSLFRMDPRVDEHEFLFRGERSDLECLSAPRRERGEPAAPVSFSSYSPPFEMPPAPRGSCVFHPLSCSFVGGIQR